MCSICPSGHKLASCECGARQQRETGADPIICIPLLTTGLLRLQLTDTEHHPPACSRTKTCVPAKAAEWQTVCPNNCGGIYWPITFRPSTARHDYQPLSIQLKSQNGFPLQEKYVGYLPLHQISSLYVLLSTWAIAKDRRYVVSHPHTFRIDSCPLLQSF